MSTQPQPLMSPAEYLAFERAAHDVKHEYFRGEIFAMGGASREHNLIGVNLTGMLYASLLDSRCEAYANDMRVKVNPTGLYAYPDFVVTCEEPQFEDQHGDTLLNPQLIVEVLSDSTERYDRGKKFEHYRQIESLMEYMLVAQDRPHVERFARDADGTWRLAEATGLDRSIVLSSINATLPLSDLYHRVEFVDI